MDGTPPLAGGKTPPQPDRGPGDSLLWLLPLAAVLLAQAWLTLGLFAAGPATTADGLGRAWDRLLDDQPLVSGRHPLHLYHGTLGARSLLNHGSLCCYDPAFQAGYPKTPVFDSGSRPAELFLLASGGECRPAAYKIGVAVVCVLAPLVVALAGLAAGLNRASACLAAALAVLVWWGGPCRATLESGQVHLLLASLAALAQVGLLIRFDRAPGLLTWLGILVSGYLGWFAHPLFFALGLPLALIYYLTVGAKHHLVWHLALLSGLAGALLSNGFWLLEWVRSWWIQAPTPPEPQTLVQRTLQSLWDLGLWGTPVDRGLAVAMVVLGLAGVIWFNQSRQRATARLLGLGAAGFVLLALAGAVWPPLESFGTSALAVPALLFATLPAVHAFRGVVRLFARGTGPWRAAFLTVIVLGGAAAAGWWSAPDFADRFVTPEPLALGLGEERMAVAEALRRQTTSEARILWEDLAEERPTPGRWTALLPLLTDRAYLGGLDPDAHIEHAYAGLVDGVLAGKPLREWTNDDLAEFCTRYNVGWVVCRLPSSAARLRTWKAAVEESAVPGGWLFRIDRKPSFTLKGQARWVSADAERIVLADVVPEDGEVVLSLHYHQGLRASPSRVKLERDVDADDPIPFVRLKLAAPAARVTLTWRE